MTDPPRLELHASPGLTAWMHERKLSLAFTTYQIGKLFLVGVQGEGRLSVFERTFDRCMGLWSHASTLLMSSRFQLWRFENMLEAGQTHEGYDRVFVPRVGYTTGDLNVHDVGLDTAGRILFANTLFSCVAAVSERHSFIPVWWPRWISRLAPEDRCHLNGLALAGGVPRFATAAARTDAPDGWREQRRGGGCVVDIPSGDVVADALSMPHSPRVHEGKLWLLEAGTGHLGWVDPARGVFEPVAFCPGFVRGLAFSGPFAVVGMSKHRENRTFSGLALEEKLRQHKTDARCGVQVIDTRTGSLLHWLYLEGMVAEIYDVVVLEGARRPMALGFVSNEIERVLHVGPAAPLVPRPTAIEP